MKRDSVTRELAAIALLALTIAGAHRFWTYRVAARYEAETAYQIELASPARHTQSFFTVR